MNEKPSGERSAGEQDMGRGLVRWAVQMAIFILFFAVCLFVSAGSLDWTMGWIYVGLLAANQVITALVLIPGNAQLLARRAQNEGPRDLDRVLAGVMALFGPAATLIVAGLDVRFVWSPVFVAWLQVVGFGVAVLGSLLTIWAMRSNRFFYGVLCIDAGGGHSVATRGPYRAIRHPGYLGAILFDLGTPLMLGSAWTFIPALLTVAAIVVRTRHEDRALVAGLAGYREYTQRVRSRLLPGIW